MPTPHQKTALITGITGQDGSYLADLLLEKGYRVVGMVRRTSEYVRRNIAHLVGRVVIEYGDLADFYVLADIIQRHQPDEVYNLASQSVPADSWSLVEVTPNITAMGPVRLMEAIRRFAPKARLYQGSTREIFGGVEVDVMDETTPTQANNPYGVAKVYAHQMIGVARQSYGMFACAGILFNHESPRRALHFVTRKITMAAACIKLGLKRTPLDELGRPLVDEGQLHLGNLEAKRDWGFAGDYVDAMWRMLQQDAPSDFIIATNTIHDVREVCRIAFEYVDLDWQECVRTDTKLERPTEITASRGNYARAERLLGWKPRTTFTQLIEMMVKSDLELAAKGF